MYTLRISLRFPEQTTRLFSVVPQVAVMATPSLVAKNVLHTSLVNHSHPYDIVHQIKKDDLLQLFFQKTSDSEAEACLKSDLVEGFGSVLQDPKTLQIRVLLLNTAKLACHVHDMQGKVDPKPQMNISFDFEKDIDILSIYLVSPDECVGTITRCIFAHEDVFGTDLVLCCNSAGTLHIIEVQDASTWLPQGPA